MNWQTQRMLGAVLVGTGASLFTVWFVLRNLGMLSGELSLGPNFPFFPTVPLLLMILYGLRLILGKPLGGPPSSP